MRVKFQSLQGGNERNSAGSEQRPAFAVRCLLLVPRPYPPANSLSHALNATSKY